MKQTLLFILLLSVFLTCSKTPIEPDALIIVNTKPIIDSLYISTTEIAAADTVFMQVITHDAEGDSLYILWTASTGRFTDASAAKTGWVSPENAQSGTQHSLNLTVHDGQDSLTISRMITISERPNTTPKIDSISVSASEIISGQQVNLKVYATDSDKDPLTYRWTATGGTFSEPLAAATVWTSPSAAESGSSYVLSVTVNDGTDSVSSSRTIKIFAAANTPPVIESLILSKMEVTPGGKLRLSALTTDKDGDSLFFRWQVTVGILTNPNHSITEWEFPLLSAVGTTAEVTLTLSDGQDSVFASQKIIIVAGISLTGYAYYRGTKIPLSGVSVKLLNLTAMTDPDGFYQIDYVPGPGDYELQASKIGFDDYTAKIAVSEVNNKFDLPMNSETETRILSGYLQTIDEIKLGGMKITLLNPDLSVSVLSATSVRDGSYKLTGIPPGERQFYVENENNANQSLPDTFKLDVKEEELVFNPRIKILREVYREVGTTNQKNWLTLDCLIQPDSYQLFGSRGYLKMINLVSIPVDAEKLTFGFYKFVHSLDFQFCQYALFNEKNQGTSYSFASGNKIKAWTILTFENDDRYFGHDVYLQFWTTGDSSQLFIFETFLSYFW